MTDCLFCGQRTRSIPGGPVDCCDYRLAMEIYGAPILIAAHKHLLRREKSKARELMRQYDEEPEQG